MPSTERIPTSFAIPKSLLDQFKNKIGHRYGDKSKVVVRLIEMYVKGEIKVIIPARYL